MTWLILIWPFLATISANRNRSVERIAIIHALISCYVSWGVITGIWELPGTWEKNDFISSNEITQWYGWGLWIISLITALLAGIDKDIRFESFSDARFPAKHRQMSYVFAFFGIWLIAYGGGLFSAPSFISAFIAIAAISEGMDVSQAKESSNK